MAVVAFVVLALVAAASAWVWRRLGVRRVWRLLGATVTGMLAFQGVAFLQWGSLDPMVLLAMAMSALPIAVVVLVCDLLWAPSTTP